MSKIRSLFLVVLLCSVGLFQNTGVSAFQSRIYEKGSKPVMKSSSNNEDPEKLYGVKTFNPLRLLVLRLGLTEPAWTSPLNYQKKEGTFNCAYCGQELFDASSKYDSGSGWPSFWRTVDEGAVSYKMEFDGRLECRCGRCSSHLGHVFLDGPRPSDVPEELFISSPASDPRSKREDGRLPRFCINGASLRVKEASKNSSN